MKRIGIYYGSSTGTTAEEALRIASALGVNPIDVHDVGSAHPSSVADYDLLVLGTSTWGDGELQDDWNDFIAALEAMDLSDKEVALFGSGDESHSDTFCDAVAELHERLEPTGCRFIGEYNVAGYDFDSSKAMKGDGEAIGLLLDDVNHPDLTDGRIEAWALTIK